MSSFYPRNLALPAELTPWLENGGPPASTQRTQGTTSDRRKYDPARYLPREYAKEEDVIVPSYGVPRENASRLGPSNRYVPDGFREVELSRTAQPRAVQEWKYGNEPLDLATEQTTLSVGSWAADFGLGSYLAETSPGKDLPLQPMPDEGEQYSHSLSHKDSLELIKPFTKSDGFRMDNVDINHSPALSPQQEQRWLQMTLEDMDSVGASAPLESPALWNNTIPPIQLSFLTAQAQAEAQQMFENAVGPHGTSLSWQQTRDLLLLSGLLRDDLGHVWTLSDTLKAGRLLFPEFALAMYLCNLKLSGQELPSTLSDQIRSEVSSMVDIISFNVIEEKTVTTHPASASQGPSSYKPLPIQQPQLQTHRSNDVRVQMLAVSNRNDRPVIGMARLVEDLVIGISTHESTNGGNDFIVRGDVPKATMDVSPEAYGWGKEHRVLDAAEEEPMTVIRHLGQGSMGIVEEVRRVDTALPTMVRKRVSIHKNRTAQSRRIIHDEVAILSKLLHPNIVALVGSYEDHRDTRHSLYCLLMVPVGDNDLENFLIEVGELDRTARRRKFVSWIRSWYADLASAVEYMHSQGVRHQDIKPSNIIHKDGRIFFTDFSSSARFQVGHTTSTNDPARSTAMYAAPENALGFEGRYGRAFDVFGLGCVFCDMLSVELGRAVKDFWDFLLENGNGRKLLYSENLASIHKWFLDAQPIESSFFKDCISEMLQQDRELRPTASDVLKTCRASFSHSTTRNLGVGAGMSDMVARRRSKMIRNVPGAFPM